jgi:hypothetical protein
MANISGVAVFAIRQEEGEGRNFPSGENRRAINRQAHILWHSAPGPTHCGDSSFPSSELYSYIAGSYVRTQFSPVDFAAYMDLSVRSMFLPWMAIFRLNANDRSWH